MSRSSHRSNLLISLTWPVLVLILCTHSQSGWAQESGKPSLGLCAQAYPTGEIPGICLELPVRNDLGIEFRIGYNVVRHGDAGVHEDEKGGGFGGSIGFRHYFHHGKTGLSLGPRIDIWQNEINWKDHTGTHFKKSGTSRVTVLQPTLVLGYNLRLGYGDWFLSPSIAFGLEINARTVGEDTGQGPILLAGLEFHKMLGK